MEHMPNTTSAKKALRQTRTRYARNVIKKRVLKDAIKQFKKSVDTEDFSVAKEKLSLVFKKLDKSAKANIIKKNKADRLKSRLSIYLSKKSQTS